MKMNNDTDKKAISKLDLEMHSENCQTNSHFCKKTTPLRCFTGHQVRKIDKKSAKQLRQRSFLNSQRLKSANFFIKKLNRKYLMGF